MKKLIVCLLPALALLLASSLAGRADQFTQMANNPNGYWVPYPTPPVVYYYPGPGYYAEGPYYYGPYGPRYHGPRIFLGFGFHIH